MGFPTLLESELLAVSKALGDTEFGFTGTEIGLLLSECGLKDIDSKNTKYKRLFNAFCEQSRKDNSTNCVYKFIQVCMEPARGLNTQSAYEKRRFEINRVCGDMDVEKAYILGLLHDIGRKFGVRHLGHVYDGYVYMKSLGYDEVAKICLTHSFNNHTIDEYIGKFDVTDEELTIIKTELAKTIYDEYDRLIQLCDCLAGAEGVLDIENRMNDVKKRYGFYPQDKWNSNMNLKQYFEGKMNKDIYLICEKDTFAPGDL